VSQPVNRGRGSAVTPRIATVSWFWLVILAMVALGTGYLGLLMYEEPESLTAGPLLDLLYRDLQLFVLEFDPIDGRPVPWPLQATRFLAPVITFLAAAFAIVGGSWWLRTSVRRGYAIVVGDTAEALAVVAAKRAQGRKAVFEIPAGDVSSLRAAGVGRARTVYACADDREDVAANVAAALAAVSARRGEGPRVYAHVSDPDLAIGLRARRLMTEPGQRVEFFSMDELAAWAHVASESFPAGTDSRVLVAGAGAFGRAVIVALARRATSRLTVIVVDRDADRVIAELQDRWPVVGQRCDLVPITADSLDDALRSDPQRDAVGRPLRAYICYDDEHVALRSALAATPLWRGETGSLVVRLSRLARHATAFRTDGLLDNIGDRLVVADVASLAAEEVVKDRDMFEQLAEVAHGRYLRIELARGRRLGDTLALRPWSELREDFRDNNYDLACHLAVKLRRVGATVAPRSSQNSPFTLTPDEVNLLAPIEHDRWMANRRKHRWVYGPERDDKHRIHPDLVAWEKLTPESQEKDRDAVRAIPEDFGEVLAEFGLQIVRL
jgi:hypothetical protein